MQKPEFNNMDRDTPYLVGVSGGADSVALLRLMVESGFQELIVCHLDHGLRGAASEGDASFTEKLAAELGLPFSSKKIALSSGAGMEDRARSERQLFFANCARKWHCHNLVLGHHAGDQGETALWNLIRGSRGLRGMSGKRDIEMDGENMTVWRPLLAHTPEQLKEWLRKNGHSWREDATNREAVAVRNRFRNELFPLLEEITGRDVTAALAKAVDGGEELREIEKWAVAEARVTDPQGRIHVRRLQELPLSLQRACIYHYLREQAVPDVGRAEVNRVLGMLEPGASARVNLPGDYHARRKEARVWVEKSKG